MTAHRSIVLGLLVATAGGCLFTADFDRFDTAPAVEVVDSGPPIVITGSAVLSVAAGGVRVRPGAPAPVVVSVKREGNAPPSDVRIQLESLAAGLTSKPAVIAADKTEATLTVEVASAAAIAPILGKTVTANVVGSVSDPQITGVTTSSIAIEVWGSPGQVDPTRGGSIVFDIQKSMAGPIQGTPLHTAAFVDTSFAVVAGPDLFVLDEKGTLTKKNLHFAGDPVFHVGGTVAADGANLSVVSTRIIASGTTLTYEARSERGAPGGIAPQLTFTGGDRCVIDRESRRAACREKTIPTPSTVNSAFRNVEAAGAGAVLAPYNDVDLTSIHRGAPGWLVLGTNVQTGALIVDLLDDAGAKVPTFTSPSLLGFPYDATVDATGFVIAGVALDPTSPSTPPRARITRHTWSGAFDPMFGSGSPVLLPGGITLCIADSPRGLLVGTVEILAGGSQYAGRVVRIDSRTGAIDATFADKGSLTLPAQTGPVALRDTGTRVLVGYLTQTGATVVHLFP